jgi:protocatechuate 3,4-dioxygenase beta subunit
MKFTRIIDRCNRRDALGLLGAFGASAAVACGEDDDALAPAEAAGPLNGGIEPAGAGLGTPSCILTPELAEGPFFVDERLERSDLVAGETLPGVTNGSPLILDLGIHRVDGADCSPFEGAIVDIWHADVGGLYSATASGFIQPTDTLGQTFLRAYQVVGADGRSSFRTIYPGWYATRTIHVHVKVRAAIGGAMLEANTQVFFDDAITDEVFAGSEYLARGPRSIPGNTSDEIYNGTGVGRAIDTVGPPPGQARPGELMLAQLSRELIAGRAGHRARLDLAIRTG